MTITLDTLLQYQVALERMNNEYVDLYLFVEYNYVDCTCTLLVILYMYIDGMERAMHYSFSQPSILTVYA